MINNEDLIKMAMNASKNSYAPLSKFKVGAALLTKDGKVYLGSNIESKSCLINNCAERTAFFSAISNGEKDFKAVAVMGSADEKFKDLCTPCGICRQLISEFCDNDFKIVLGRINSNNKIEVKEYTLSELLPDRFILK